MKTHIIFPSFLALFDLLLFQEQKKKKRNDASDVALFERMGRVCFKIISVQLFAKTKWKAKGGVIQTMVIVTFQTDGTGF